MRLLFKTSVKFFVVLAALIFFYTYFKFYHEESKFEPMAVKFWKLLRDKQSNNSDTFKISIKKEIIEKIQLIPGKYWLYKRKATWQESELLCQNDKRVLAAFTTREDALAVINKIYNISHFSMEYLFGKERKEKVIGLNWNYWIGLFDFGHEGNWEWTHGRGFLKYQDFWTPGQPDHRDLRGNKLSDREQHCVGMWNPIFHRNTPQKPRKHSFDDKECDLKLYFICENFQPKNITHV